MSKKLLVVTIALIVNLCALITLLIIDIRMDSERLSSDEIECVITTTESLDNRMENYLGQASADTTVYNSNTIGYLQVYDTTFNYPLMYSSDLMYYTKHDSNNKVNSNGAIFLDSRIIDFDNEVLLIHGLVTDDNTMFSPLRNYTEQEWAQQHNSLSLTINNYTESYKLFAVLKLETEEPVIYLEHADKMAYENFYNSLLSQSEYQDSSIEFKSDKRMVILNTADNDMHYLICFLEEQ